MAQQPASGGTPRGAVLLSGRMGERAVILAGCLTAILLIVVGTLMDRHERAERERQWRK